MRVSFPTFFAFSFIGAAVILLLIVFMLIPLGDETKQIQELIQYADGNKQIVIRAIRAYKEKQRNNDKPFTLSTPESKRQIKQYIDQLKK